MEFYSKLGFSETERVKRGYDTVVLMDGHDIGLEIFIDPNHPAKVEESLGVRNISLTVDDIEEAASVFCVELNNDWHGEKYLIIRDPDGMSIQLHEEK